MMWVLCPAWVTVMAGGIQKISLSFCGGQLLVLAASQARPNRQNTTEGIEDNSEGI
jgi:hypothetical protein